MSKYLFLSLLSFFFAFLLTPLVRRAALGIGAIDQPDERKVHQWPIARLGGVAILAPLLALGLPLFDTLLAVHLLEVANGRYRFLFAGGRGLFEADREHVHHRLLDLGPFKEVFLGTLFALLAAKLLPFYALGIYRRSWRHSSIADMIGLGKALLIGSLLFALPATLVLSASLPASVMVIDFLLFSFLTAGARTSFRLLEHVKFRGEERERRVLSLKGQGAGGPYAAGVPPEPAAGAEAGGAGGRRSRQAGEELQRLPDPGNGGGDPPAG